MTIDNYGTWLEIDLGALTRNFQIVRQTAGVSLMPIIKANAYGHGLEKVARSLEMAGAEWFGVARIEEALLLREIGIKAKIIALGYTSPARVPHAIKERITLTVYDPVVVQSYARQAEKLSEVLNLHVKVDTGMGRLGILAEKALDFIADVANSPALNLEGVFTHFACADEPDKPVTQNQITEFLKILKEMELRGVRPPFIHAANTAGTLVYPDARFNLARVGLALYGLSPSSQVPIPSGVVPCLSWKTRLISIKTFPPGHGISYGYKYFTQKEERIGVIAVGYGDGLRRQDGNRVLIRGKKADVIGSVCMDQCMVRLDDIPEAQIGDEVILIGRQEDQQISATDIALRWDTINYEVICGLAARMPRYYRNNVTV